MQLARYTQPIQKHNERNTRKPQNNRERPQIPRSTTHSTKNTRLQYTRNKPSPQISQRTTPKTNELPKKTTTHHRNHKQRYPRKLSGISRRKPGKHQTIHPSHKTSIHRTKTKPANKLSKNPRMNPLEHFNIDLEPEEVKEINSEITRIQNDERANLHLKFRPGVVQELKQYEDFTELKASIIDWPEHKKILASRLEALKPTNYVKVLEENLQTDRYKLNKEYREKAYEFSKYKLADMAANILEPEKEDEFNYGSIEVDTENIVDDLQKYEGSIIDEAAVIHGNLLLEPVRGIEYSQDTKKYLEKLNLLKQVDDSYQVLGSREDFQIARATVEEINQNAN